jgi:hypothetical protein
MASFEEAQRDVHRLLGRAGSEEDYQKSELVCSALQPIKELASAINAECRRLQQGGNYRSLYSSIHFPSVDGLRRVLRGEKVTMDLIIRTNDAIYAVCSNGKEDIRKILRQAFKEGQLPDGSVARVTNA